jgi:hypothetical protein
MNKDLSHLSPNEMDKLIEKYYGGVTVKTIIKEYDLDLQPAGL